MMAVAFFGALLCVPLWAFSEDYSRIMAGAFCMRFMVQGASGIVPAHINELSPDRGRGFLPGFAYQCGNMIAASIAWVQSLLAKEWPYPQVMEVSVSIIFVGAIVVTLLGPERRGMKFG